MAEAGAANAARIMDAKRETTRVGGSRAGQPAILLLCCASAGIVLDRYADIESGYSTALVLVLFLTWIVFFRMHRDSAAALSLCVIAIALGSLWHHVWWNYHPADSIAAYANDLPKPQRLRGRITQEPRWIVAPAPDVFDSTPAGIRTNLTLSADSIQNGGKWSAVRGDVSVYVEGQLSGFGVGDHLEAIGRLSRPPGPRNPGQFDLGEYCRSERRLCSLSVLQPDAIRMLDRASICRPLRQLATLRQKFDQLIWHRLTAENAALGSGLLLGLREQIDQAEKANYMMTGTIHLLAISGLHVGILAGGILALGMLGIVPRRSSLWLTMSFVVFYSALVEFDPPVTRATVLILVWCGSKLMGRPGFSFNSLAVAGFIVLISNPTQLFQVGAQLSFLAVATLTVAHRFLYHRAQLDPLDELLLRSRPLAVQWGHAGLGIVGRVIVVSALVWLLAVPLVAHRFHIVAPIALIANPLLMLPLTAALLSGFAFLVFGWWLPPAEWLLGGVLEASLAAIRWIVDTSSQVPGAYWWTPGPSLLFVLFFFAFSVAVFMVPRTRLPARWALSSSCLVLCAGWLIPSIIELQRQEARSDVEVIFADVGHGGCALIKLPGGQHLLFDAGSNASPHSVTRIITGVLWSEQVVHLDGLVISHADLDHFNAVDRLTDHFSIGVVYVPEAMIAQTNSPARELLDRLQSKGIPVRVACAGQFLRGRDGVELAILHPRPSEHFSNDNAGSIVCELRYGPQRVLLTGDVEREGIEQLLAQPVRRRVAAVAPHHGSKHSSPQRFVAWSNASHIVVCDDWKSPDDQDLRLYEAAASSVLLTGRDGAVRIRLFADQRAAELQSWASQPWR